MSDDSTTTPEGIETGTGTGTGTGKKKVYASQASFQRMRPVITRLYHDEGRTLHETAEILGREYGFFATPRMYKSRIRDWGLDKHVRRDDALAVWHAWRRLQLSGREKGVEVFVVGRRKVGVAAVGRYMSRHPLLRARYEAGIVSVPDDGAVPFFEGSEEGQGEGGEVVGEVVPVVGMGRVMEAGREMRLPEEILRIVRGFCDGAIQAGIWVRDFGEDGSEGGWFDGRGGMADYVALQRWYRSLFSARSMLLAGEVGTAFGMLGALLDRLHRIVRIEGLFGMFYLFDLVDLFRGPPGSGSGYYDQRLAGVLVRHVVEVVRVVFGRDGRHPLKLIWERLEAIGDDAERARAVLMVFKAVLGYFASRYGMLDVNTVEIQRLYTSNVTRMLEGVDSAGAGAEAEVHEVEESMGRLVIAAAAEGDGDYDDSVENDILSRLALTEIAAGRLDEAETKLERVVGFVEDDGDPSRDSWFDVRWDYFQGRARLCVARGETEEAARFLGECVEHCRRFRSETDPRTLEAMRYLILHLEKFGPDGEAVRWRGLYREACAKALVEARSSV
ncbi:hypothetical protein QBC47DRAFT_431567 [Echria macrotheca]|uniref:Clr5 domain-containing protein n=1 Tax=Echria macrotheca TaxID=438768 RepID=A0AAJ0F385_9PEZI|nr:hypothetical protein QBC47DRAFT_431567 [Echria macrotheca]